MGVQRFGGWLWWGQRGNGAGTCPTLRGRRAGKRECSGKNGSCPPAWAGVEVPLLHYCGSQVKLSSCIKMGVSVSPGTGEPSPEDGEGAGLDLDDGGTPQAQRGVGGHRVSLDLVPVEPQDLKPGIVHDIHHGAKAADGELCGGREDGELSTGFGPGSNLCDVTDLWGVRNIKGGCSGDGSEGTDLRELVYVKVGRKKMKAPPNHQLFLQFRLDTLCS